MLKRLICIHHRLAGMTGHRYTEALGILAAAERRAMPSVLLISAHADGAVREALPQARAVLHDPVFRSDLSFDERTDAFVRLLRETVEPEVAANDRVLLTVATQCEARALTVWLASLPEEQRPWVLCLFVSDRWNRHGSAERERQCGEFQMLAADIAEAGTAVRRKLVFASLTSGLCDELTELLGVRVLQSPMAIDVETIREAPLSLHGRRPVVGFPGGTRAEKGSHRIPQIIAECRRRADVDFVFQLTNELLPPDVFDELRSLAAQPGIHGVEGPIDIPAYRDMLSKMDVVLLPYERVPYRWRISSIMIEAVLVGRPVVAPDRSWMSDRIDAGAAIGAVYRGDTCEAIVDAVMTCLADLPALALRAGDARKYWLERHGYEAFIDWLEREIRARQAHGALCC